MATKFPKPKPHYVNGIKFDEGKPDYLQIFTLLDWDFLKDGSEVMRMGKEKYGFENWKRHLNPERIERALIRHLVDYLNGDKLDKDTHKSHLLHIFCNTMFLYHYDLLGDAEHEKVKRR